MKAALYARVSTSDQDPGLQVDDLRRLAAQRGWEVVGVFVDHGVSGTKDRRPALDDLMTLVRQGRVDGVVVWRFDRFARSTRHLVEALNEFRARGVEFVSMQEQIDTGTTMGKAMFTVIAAMAELERDIIRERVKAGVDRARAQGRLLGRPRRSVDVEAAVEMLRAGRSQRSVAMALKVPRGTLRGALARHAGGNGARETHPGAPSGERVEVGRTDTSTNPTDRRVRKNRRSDTSSRVS